MSPPIRPCGLDAFADLLPRFAFSQSISTPARSTPHVRYVPRICSAVQQPGQYGLIAFLLTRTMLLRSGLLRSGCADGRTRRSQNLDQGQFVFVDAIPAGSDQHLCSSGWLAGARAGCAATHCLRRAIAGGGAERLAASTAQAHIKLAERSVTIQYLCDGLYQACRAYALILGGIDKALIVQRQSSRC